MTEIEIFGFDGDLLGLIIWIAILVLAASYLSYNRRPAEAIARLLAVIFIPVLGLLFFLLVGAGRLPKHRRHKQQFVTDAIIERDRGALLQPSTDADWPDWLPSITVLNRSLGALPMVGGNRAELFADYHGSIAAMAADIDRAREYVHVEFFILVHDDTTAPFFDALARARERGLHWHELMARFSGPIVRELDAVFITDWYSETEQLLHLDTAASRPGGELGDELGGAPTVLHAKHLSIDDDVAIIGSSNMDIRSLSLHMELMVLVQSREFVDDLRQVEDDYRSRSHPLHLDEWMQRPRTERVFDNLMRLTSSLM